VKGEMKAGLCYLTVIVSALVLQLAVFPQFNVKNLWVNIGCICGLYAVYLAIFFAFRDRNPIRTYGISPRIKPSNAARVVFITALCICSFMLLQFAFVALFKAQSQEIKINGWGQYFACVFAMAVLPAVIEELVFRGIILHNLKKYGAVVAVLASALCFSLFHMNPAQLVYQFILGIVFAIVVLKTGNLVLAMLLHFLNNFFVITYTFITGSDRLAFSWDATTIIATILLAFLGAVVIMGQLGNLKKERNAE